MKMLTGVMLLVLSFSSAPQPMTTIAKGTFDVEVVPQPPGDSAGGAFAQFFIDKQFRGELEGTSVGQMVSSGDPRSGNAGYVALERVRATLAGHRGSFVLLHRGVLTAGATSLEVSVVPASGTGGLEGIAGRMAIVIEGKKHSYEFEYSLPRSR